MTSTIEDKLDKVMFAIQDLKKDFNERLDKIEKRYQQFENATNEKLAVMSKRIEKLEKLQLDAQKEALMQESYNKRLNILIHGVEEDRNCAWETHENTLKKFDDFLTTALKIDSDDINVVDIHRLPQTPLRIRGKKVNRPIIVKLDSMMEKSKIFRNLKRLKSYNDLRKLDNKSSIFVTDHLPKVFLEQKKLLMPQFKEAKRNQQKTSWRAENGEYVLYIDNKKFSISSLK